MLYKYGEISSSQIHKEKERLKDAIFILLPYKEESYEFLDAYFVSLQQRISGLNHLLGYPQKIINLMEVIEAARYEDDLKMYRKAILDACTLVDKIEEGDSYV